ncbi:MAG: hypothetical protein Q7J05_04150 [Paludibacter sp.]|nr:hypothetical protein [Paludibacter sp.]
MGDNFEKTKEILAGVKGPTATAIKALSMDLDHKFADLDKKNDERHKAILNAISINKKQTEDKIKALETSTNDRFSKLKVVMFFSEHYRIFLVVTLALLIVLGIIQNDKTLDFFRTFK